MAGGQLINPDCPLNEKDCVIECFEVCWIGNEKRRRLPDDGQLGSCRARSKSTILN
jgi:hypothetical protein